MASRTTNDVTIQAVQIVKFDPVAVHWLHTLWAPAAGGCDWQIELIVDEGHERIFIRPTADRSFSGWAMGNEQGGVVLIDPCGDCVGVFPTLRAAARRLYPVPKLT